MGLEISWGHTWETEGVAHGWWGLAQIQGRWRWWQHVRDEERWLLFFWLGRGHPITGNDINLMCVLILITWTWDWSLVTWTQHWQCCHSMTPNHYVLWHIFIIVSMQNLICIVNWPRMAEGWVLLLVLIVKPKAYSWNFVCYLYRNLWKLPWIRAL